MTILLLDGDVYAYRCAASCMPTMAKPFHESEEAALSRLEIMVQGTFRTINPKDFKCFLGGPRNWRKDIYPDYKGNRKDTPPPPHLAACRNYLISKYEAQVCDGIEADDALGIEQTAAEGNSVISTNDKDMRTIPGYHHNPVTGERFFVSPSDALRYFYSQIILGDKADNIPGFDGKLRSTMPLFIQRLVAPLEEMTEEIEMYEHVCDIYSDQVSWADDWQTVLHRNASVLYILRKENEYWKTPEKNAQDVF